MVDMADCHHSVVYLAWEGEVNNGAVMNRRDLFPAGLAATAMGVALTNRANAQEACVAPCYEITPLEISKGIEPTDYQYPPGAVLRYGADPTGLNDSTQAIRDAINATPAEGGIIDFSVGSYRCDFPINCDNRRALTFRGRGGVTSGIECTLLRFTGGV